MVTVREAATVMIVRDAPDLQVLLLRRSPRAVFGASALVFPGGAVDPGDRSPDATAAVRGLGEGDAATRLGLAEGGLGFWVAAVRETFEEAGVLLARDPRTGHPADPARVPPDLRHGLQRRSVDAATLLAEAALVVDADDLVVFSHWLTPVGPPRRYDTWFFVAEAPPNHDATSDRDETVEAQWVAPADVLARDRAGAETLIHPTRRSLEVLARYSKAGDVLGAVRSAWASGRGSAEVVADAGGERVRLPGEQATARAGWTIPLPSGGLRDRGAA